MTGFPRFPSLVSAACAGMLLFATHADAGCNCSRGAGTVFSAPIAAPMMMAAPMPMTVPTPMMQHHGSSFGAALAPPPGTLGRTYQIRSRPIRIDEHPRVAKLEITGASHLELVMEGVQDFEGDLSADGVWRFESEKPLLPGVPHIYKVKAVSRNQYNQKIDTAVRTVRLIPGRILYISF